jgi:C4-dicarboxylate transporter, DctQ subunit
MRAIELLIRALARIGVALAAASLLGSMLLIGYSVVMRYFANHPIPWVDELAGYLLVASVMLAAADALFHGEHIRVDILVDRLSARGRHVAATIGLLAVLAAAALLAVEGADMVAFSRMVGLKSNGYLAVPMWIPQTLVPVGAVLMGMTAIACLVAAWRAGPPEAPGGSEPSGPE